MTEKEYKEHIHNDIYCRIVIRHASIDAAHILFAMRREISLEYLSEERFMPFSTKDEYFA